MAELILRAGLDDAPALGRFLGERGEGLAPLRVVADAHAAAKGRDLAASASAAGVPFLVDPQTFFFQDQQEAWDPWASLPYAESSALTPADITQSRLHSIVDSVLSFQVEQQATFVIPPYFHLGRSEAGWAELQTAAWRRTRRSMDRLGIELPVFAVVSLDWTRLRGVGAFYGGSELLSALRILAPNELGLAVSKAHLGAKPAERLIDLSATVARLSEVAPVFAWQQGLLGEVCVAAGAAGYETGIGRRESLDMTSMLASRRTFDRDAPRQARGVYVKALARSIPKKSLETLSSAPGLWSSLYCLDAACCAPAGQTMLRDARGHTVRARRSSLAELTSIGRPDWRWGALADRASVGLRLADRINRRGETALIDTGALEATLAVGQAQRRGDGRIRTA